MSPSEGKSDPRAAERPVDRVLDKSEPDRLFESLGPQPFEFTEEGARVFDDMADRSIPLYRELLWLTTQWGLEFHQPGTAIVDFGCSTGTQLFLLARRLSEPTDLIGIDLAPSMLERAQKKLAAWQSRHRIQLLTPAEPLPALPTSVLILNYVLQFTEIEARPARIADWIESLTPGGLVIVSEKVKLSSPLAQTQTEIYEEFKSRNGYSREEIARKRAALKGVLVPATEPEYRDWFDRAGVELERVLAWQQFRTWVGVKP